MHLQQIIVGLTSLGALTAAAPSLHDVKGMKHEIREEVVPTSTIVSSPSVPQNTTNFVGLDSQAASDQFLQFAEEDLLAQVKQQIALSAELQAIKNNIRLNSLAAQFPQVNTVLVVVTNIIDARNPLLINNRYLVNSLFVDNGFPDKQQVVYATESQSITISATSTSTTSSIESITTASTFEPTPTSVLSPADPSNLDLNLTTPPTFHPPALLPPTLGVTTSAILTTTITTILPLTSFHLNTFTATPFLDPTTAFLLPFAALAPTSPMALILPSDPANLIYAHQIDFLNAACLGVLGGAGNTAHLYGSAQQALEAQLAGLLQVGGGGAGAHVVVEEGKKGEEEGKKKAEEEGKKKGEERKKAEEERKKAEEERKKAKKAEEEEDKKAKKAEEERKKAEVKKGEEEAKKKAEEAKKADEEKKKVEEGRKEK